MLRELGKSNIEGHDRHNAHTTQRHTYHSHGSEIHRQVLPPSLQILPRLLQRIRPQLFQLQMLQVLRHRVFQVLQLRQRVLLLRQRVLHLLQRVFLPFLRPHHLRHRVRHPFAEKKAIWLYTMHRKLNMIWNVNLHGCKIIETCVMSQLVRHCLPLPHAALHQEHGTAFRWDEKLGSPY